MEKERYTRMSHPRVLFQAHTTEDSRYVILPVLESASRITGWVVYDALQGEIEQDHHEPFGSLVEAKDQVDRYRRKEAAPAKP